MKTSLKAKIIILLALPLILSFIVLTAIHYTQDGHDLINFGLTFLIALIISILLIYQLLNKYILGDFQLIINASKDVAKGNLDINIPINTQGEMSQISSAFNTMAKTLLQREKEQKELHQKAFHSQQQLQSILDNSSTLICIKDLQGKYLLIDHNLEKLHNISNEKAKGKGDIDFFSAEEAKKLRNNDLLTLDANKAMEFEEQAFLNGNHFTVISAKFPLKSETGEVYALCVISTDISERKKMEKALQKQAEELLKSQKLLKERLLEVEQFNQLAVGRELKMIELKKEVNQLLEQQDLAIKYQLKENQEEK